MTLFMFKDEHAGLSLPSITITPLCRKAGAAGGSKKSASNLHPSSLPMANGVAVAFKPFRCSAGIIHYNSFRKSLIRVFFCELSDPCPLRLGMQPLTGAE
jgi:hypothetical protein